MPVSKPQYEPDEKELSYLAGLFDGEGCVTISRHEPNGKTTSKNVRYVMHVAVAMQGLPLLEKFHKAFGGSIYFNRQRKVHVWNVTSNTARYFLTKIKNFSILKRPQIEIALDYLDSISSYSGGCQQISQQELAIRDFWYRRMKKAKENIKSFYYGGDTILCL